MTTKERSATANGSSLMAQASQSTANLGWLQEYTQSWMRLRAITGHILKMQKEQRTYDQTARDMLLQLKNLADDKCETLEAAYADMLARHERLMTRIVEGNGND